jgi:FdhD protein
VTTLQSIHIVKYGAAGPISKRDLAATEEPLEIRSQGATFVVTMRTPGEDLALAAGFLLSERVVTSVADFSSLT